MPVAMAGTLQCHSRSQPPTVCFITLKPKHTHSPLPLPDYGFSLFLSIQKMLRKYASKKLKTKKWKGKEKQQQQPQQ